MKISKKDEYVDKLAAKGFFCLAKVSRMAKNLQKDFKSNIVFVEVCMVDDKGNAVFEMSNIPETRRFIKRLTKFCPPVANDNEIRDALAKVVPFGFIRVFKDKNDI
jgi:hypothetical protein